MSRCPGACGQPLDETTTHADHGPQYDAKSTTCRACAALLEAQRAKSDDAKNPDAPARMWHVIKLRG